jgi:hypothetical protein
VGWNVNALNGIDVPGARLSKEAPLNEVVNEKLSTTSLVAGV